MQTSKYSRGAVKKLIHGGKNKRYKNVDPAREGGGVHNLTKSCVALQSFKF